MTQKLSPQPSFPLRSPERDECTCSVNRLDDTHPLTVLYRVKKTNDVALPQPHYLQFARAGAAARFSNVHVHPLQPTKFASCRAPPSRQFSSVEFVDRPRRRKCRQQQTAPPPAPTPPTPSTTADFTKCTLLGTKNGATPRQFGTDAQCVKSKRGTHWNRHQVRPSTASHFTQADTTHGTPPSFTAYITFSYQH